MCQNLLIFLKKELTSIHYIHYFFQGLTCPFPLLGSCRSLFIFVDLFVFSALVNGMFSLSIVDLLLESILSCMRYIEHHGSHLLSSLSLQVLGNIWLGLIRGKKFGLL